MNVRSAPATILLGTLGLLLLAALAWVGLIGPAMDDLGATDENRTQVQDRNDAMRLELVRLRRQAEELPTTDEIASRLDTIFPATADQPGFFGQVSDIATDAGISPEEITVLSPGVPVILGAADAAVADPETAEPVATTPSSVAVQDVTVGIQGDYTELTAVLAGLEDMPRAFLVGSIDVTADDEGLLSMSVVGSTFVAPPLQPQAPTE